MVEARIAKLASSPEAGSRVTEGRNSIKALSSDEASSPILLKGWVGWIDDRRCEGGPNREDKREEVRKVSIKEGLGVLLAGEHVE